MADVGIGAKGDAVRQIQGLLARAGFVPGPLDGVFGARTRAAVVAFQRRLGLRATGVVDGATLASLRPTRPSDAPPVLRRNPANPNQRHLLDDYPGPS